MQRVRATFKARTKVVVCWHNAGWRLRQEAPVRVVRCTEG
jgi:hypothetical protein